jgi:hypothetical protein
MSAQSIERAKDFIWTTKAKKIVDIYAQLIANKNQSK